MGARRHKALHAAKKAGSIAHDKGGRHQSPARSRIVRIDQAYEDAANALPQRMQLLNHTQSSTACGVTEKAVFLAGAQQQRHAPTLSSVAAVVISPCGECAGAIVKYAKGRQPR
jgi:hypothetical protein